MSNKRREQLGDLVYKVLQKETLSEDNQKVTPPVQTRFNSFLHKFVVCYIVFTIYTNSLSYEHFFTLLDKDNVW